ncbi:hypothetical protein [Streptomyces sp. NPDC053431]|uniref:hypothetical protein n=1 Tax=Streptomyces sp. NPDC053431 TaxID=3365703 RepID=UPI0037CFF563
MLLTSCSVYPVAVDDEGLTGVWSSYGSEATVEFKADGTFTGKDLDKSNVGTLYCSGISARQHGSWSLSGTFAEVTFDGVDCQDMVFSFHGSPEHYIACFTRDVTAGCTEEFDREEDGPSDPGREPAPSTSA